MKTDTKNYISQYVKLENRKGKVHCNKMMKLQIKKTGSDQNYCHLCKFFKRIPCFESNIGMTEVCSKGYFRIEAT